MRMLLRPGRFWCERLKSFSSAARIGLVALLFCFPQLLFAAAADWSDQVTQPECDPDALIFECAPETQVGSQGNAQNRIKYSNPQLLVINSNAWPYPARGWIGNESFANAADSQEIFESSSAALSMGAVPPSGDLRLSKTQSLTISGALGETITLDLGSLALKGHSVLTLEGTATTSFVINVSKQFSLSGISRIILTGGLQWDNVVFNVLGPGHVVSLKQSASLTGMLVANQRTVRLRGQSIVYGGVVANRVALRGAAQIVPSPVVSP